MECRAIDWTEIAFVEPALPKVAPKVGDIILATALVFDIDVADLIGHDRKRRLAQPRQYAMYLARTLTTYSYPQIGRSFGGRDHTTVLFAHRKIAPLAAKAPVADQLARILIALEAPALLKEAVRERAEYRAKAEAESLRREARARLLRERGYAVRACQHSTMGTGAAA